MIHFKTTSPQYRQGVKEHNLYTFKLDIHLLQAFYKFIVALLHVGYSKILLRYILHKLINKNIKLKTKNLICDKCGWIQGGSNLRVRLIIWQIFCWLISKLNTNYVCNYHKIFLIASRIWEKDLKWFNNRRI